MAIALTARDAMEHAIVRDSTTFSSPPFLGLIKLYYLESQKARKYPDHFLRC
jgi:hypothetical protein